MTPRRLIEPARLAGSALLRTQSDERLVDLTRDGNDRAFEAIVQRYRRPLLRYCTRMLSATRAEDAVQQSFLSAYSAIRSGDAELNLKPWLYRIAHNAALNALRQNGWTHEQLDEQIDGVERPDQAFERRERLGEVIVAVQALPERQRDAIVLRELEGRSYEEIASALDVTDGAVRQLLNRARTTLRAAAAFLVPPDMAARLAVRGAPAESIGARVAELCAGAGGATVVAKLGTAVVVAGAVAGGAAQAPIPGAARPDTARATAVAADTRPSASRPATGVSRLVADSSAKGKPGASAQGDRDGGRRQSGGDDDKSSRREREDDGDARDEREDSEDRGREPDEDRAEGERDSSGPGSGGSDDAPEPEDVKPVVEIADDPVSSGSGSSGSGSSGSEDPSPSSGNGSDDDR